jgi:DNA primase
MNDSPIQDIKNRLDIVDVVKDYVSLEKAGANFRALCPFHSEKTPSFFVNQARQVWRCFGQCNEGGDMFSFVMKIEGVEFGDALRILAKKAGVELKKQNPEVETKRKRLFDINEKATLFFEKQLQQSKSGKEAEKYLLDRKISKESIKEWRIGYSPTAKDALSKFLISQGYKKEEIIEAGIATGKGNYLFDRFRGRLIFPIFNLSGYVVGFGGRILSKEDERAKYINTPATMLYDKSALMYGVHSAKSEIRKKDSVIVVEGYTDVIMCHQVGHKNIVSASGTAFTSKQLDILKRYTSRIITAFDMDEAGSSATKKGVDLALEKEFDVKVIMMPKGKDPADVVAEDPEKWEDYVKKAVPIISFYFESVLGKYDLSDSHEKSKAAKEILPEIKKIKNSIERSYFVSELSYLLGVSEESVFSEMENVKTEAKKTEAKSDFQKPKSKTRKERLEEKIIYCCSAKKELAKKIDNDDVLILRKEFSNIILFLREEKNEISKEEEKLLKYYSLDEEESEINTEEEFSSCLKELKKEYIKQKLKEIEEKMREAERDENEEEEERLTKQFQDYYKKLNNI